MHPPLTLHRHPMCVEVSLLPFICYDFSPELVLADVELEFLISLAVDDRLFLSFH